jgi:hypothetical protein
MRRIALLVLSLAACGRSDTTDRVPAYLVGDPCHDRSDAKACGADPTCQWMPLGIACAEGAACISGVCQAIDSCRAHGDEASCTADASCDWVANMNRLCPPGSACPVDGGFCTRHPKDGCACACPLVCPDGADCPPCACDCQPPPTCRDGGGGPNTCTCACPLDCVAGGPCPPPCDCNCGPPSAQPVDACAEHKDEKSCRADTADGCGWTPIVCLIGENCPEGVCAAETPRPEPCVCNCPECPAGAACAPCDCNCPPGPTCPGPP